jgi:glyoxylase-like metal-dependent hydrolase (beta-lactamase superfamily II)
MSPSFASPQSRTFSRRADSARSRDVTRYATARDVDQPALNGAALHRLRTAFVNVYFIRSAGNGWVLVDAGLPGYADTIRRRAERLFGKTRPAAILLTHGHFDHIGALRDLAEAWGVPVYAHPLEMPYLTGRSPYPPPDPWVGGGLMPLMSPLFPRGPIDLGRRVSELPVDGSVPGLPGWRWVHTPGHTHGHVSFFWPAERLLIAGDAVVTTRQEALTYVMRQKPGVWRPPAYYTSDWDLARESVRRLAALQPEVLATGHGPVLCGDAMRRGLVDLATNFNRVMPDDGRYVRHPAIADGHGVVRVPPKVRRPGAVVGGLVASTVLLGALLARKRRTR